MKTILILEDNDDRIAAFQKTVAALEEALELKVWRDAPSMIAECGAFFPMTLEFFARERSLSLLEAQLMLPYGRL
jgi:hypothetical protein